jgi:hypothetical protein
MARDDWKGRGGGGAGRTAGEGSGATPPPRRGDWRGGRAATKGAPGAGGATAATGWAAHKSLAGEKLVWKFRAKVAAWGLAGLVLFGFLVSYLRTPRSTPFISAVLTEYKFPLPPNAWAYDDVENIRNELAQEASGATLDEPLTIKYQPRIEWEHDPALWLEKLRVQVRDATHIKWYQTSKGRGPDKGVVIVYLSGHGVMDSSGNPCLLFPQPGEDDVLFDRQDSKELDRGRLLPIETLLATLFPIKGEDRRDDVVKLLILDANRVDSAWNLGILYNDFFEGLDRVVKSHDVANLYVLNSCGAGQVGYAAPELGGSVFGLFVKRGLAGFADGCLGDKPDLSVSVKELHQYTVREVGKWVANFRGDVQRPELLTSKNADSAKLVVGYGKQMTSRPEPNFAGGKQDGRIKDIEQRLAEIRKQGWDYHGNESFARQAVRLRPLLWQRFTAKLLRLEALALGGDAYLDVYRDELAELNRLRLDLGRPLTEALPPNGLELAKALGAAAAPADAELEKNIQDKLKGDAKAVEPSRTAQNYLQRADVAWRWVLEQAKDARLGRDHIKQVTTSALATGGADWNVDSEPVEICFLRMLEAHLDPRDGRPDFWEQVGKAIVRRRDIERLTAPTDLRVQYPLRLAARAADEQRRLAEDFLFLGGDSIGNAKKHGQAADNGIAQADKLVRTLSDALALRDQVLDEIPAMVRYYARRATADWGSGEASDESEITQLLSLRDQVTAKLAEFQELKPDALLQFDSRRVAEFTQQLDGLRKEFDNRRGMLIGRATQLRGGSDDLNRRRVEDWMRTPLVRGELRKRLHDNWRELASSYKFVEDTATLKEGSEPPVEPASLARARRWKEHPALRLADVTRPATTESPAVSVDSLRADGARVRERMAQLIQEVADLRRPTGDMGIHADGIAPASRKRLEAADRQLRGAAFLYGASLRGVVEPAESLERYDRQRLLVWHCERALADFWGPLPGAGGKPFFQIAADRCVDLARRQLTAEKQGLGERLDARLQAAREGIVAAFEKPADQPEAVLPVDPADTSDRPHAVKLIQAPGCDFPAGTATYYLADEPGESRRAQVGTDPPGVAYAVHSTSSPSAGEQAKNYEIQSVGKLLGERHERRLRGVVLYRGHQFRRPPAVLALSRFACDRQYKYEEPDYKAPRLIVQGRERPRALMIVFDCSSSMYEPFAGFNNRFVAATKVLKDVLAELQRAAPETQVGLRLYGHRSAYQRPGGNTRAENINLPPELSRFARSKFAMGLGGGDVRPAEDTQRVVDLQDIKAARKAIEGDVLPLILPHGGTQLYLAIKEAIEDDFKTLRGAEAYDRHIVVITDGFNYQRADDGKAPAGKLVRHAALLEFLKSQQEKALADKLRPISIDAIVLDAVDQAAGDNGYYIMGSREELNRLVSAVGGHLDIFNADKPGIGEVGDPYQRLLRQIRARFGLLNFKITDLANSRNATVRVRDVGGDRPASEPGPGSGRYGLNQSIEFMGLTAHAPRNFRIDFEAATRDEEVPVEPFTFQLRGREEQIALRIKGRTLFQYFGERERLPDQLDSYDLENRTLLGKIDGPSPGQKLRLIPARPVWRTDPTVVSGTGTDIKSGSQGVLFKVYIREDDVRRIAPQPLEALALVDPQVEDRNSPQLPLLIHDVKFEPGQPCPALSFFVPRFPRAAERAKIWLWLKYQPTTALAEFTPADGPQKVPLEGARVQYTCEVDGNEKELWIKVTEWHSNPEKTLYPPVDRKTGDDPSKVIGLSEKLHLSVKFDRPKRTTRCYVSDKKTLIHHFYYPAGGETNLSVQKLREVKLQVVEVARMREGAVSMLPDMPIHVGVE